MLPPVLSPKSKKNKWKQDLDNVVYEEVMVTLIPYQGFLSGFSGFQVLTPTFFQGTVLGWL